MGRRLALLIANYTYEDEGLRRLTAPAHDAEALAEVLRDPHIAAFDEVTVLVDEPHHRIGQVIGEFFGGRRHDDLTLLYFTGHGLKDDEGRLHLAAADTRRDNLLFTSLPAEQIDRAMSGCMSRRQVLILDCCYSGAFPAAARLTKGDADVHTLERFQGRGRTVLTASDATQYSFEGDRVSGSAPQSVFTRHLVRGLRDGGADLDGDGDITLDELYAYVHDRVVGEMPQQRPKKQDDVEGRIVIARNVNWALPAHLRHALRSPIATDRLGAVESLAHLYRIGNETVRGLAEEELRRLSEDDSRSVSGAAAAHLQDRPVVEAPAPVPAPAPTPVPSGPVRARPAPGTELWSFQTDNCVRSTPTVVDGVVYVGGDGGSLHAVDAATGERRWSRALDAGPVRSTPAVRGDLVYATARRILFATDTGTGQGRWDFGERRADVSVTVGVVADRVCVANSGLLFVLDAETGTKHWGYAVGMTPHRWVVMDGPLAIVGNTGNHVYAVDAYAQRRKWGARVADSPVSGPSALSDGTLYVGNERGELHALDTSDGQRKWRHDTGSPIRAAPTVANGTVYVGNDDERLYALDAATGEVRWRFTAMGPVRTTPAVTGTTVHFGSDDGNVYAVDVLTGRERWRFPTGGPVASSPVIDGGVLYVGSDDTRLHAVVAAD
ncbi:Outer membrane protein assembly factor BamB, contains PQQ-like beta-propeller repeat [Streptomyces sp. 3213]|uniref:caspase, EACC1-associated type n=1 Tax=Streptomyces sp. 3213.3 TaxID=1855348 RepID=UPI00089AB7EA|nr:PQQ-binding-like beta-propeller repeat protein [Streptomyces sp. 3213.3]SED91354.1 Outer membrane protein assembly factor BamB, contains PQQ-like beta-propeller repeat [Streptomyces sp. 3213] [Streptomyces sp. 3213.3]